MLRDDFDYPPPKRETNWTLKEESKRSTRLSANNRAVNRTDDIEGAKTGSTAMYRGSRFEHKPNLFNVGDIEGAAPSRLTKPAVNKPNTRHLDNRDIEHSYPESKLFTTPRVVNPLEPSYPLPAANHRVPTPPAQKFVTNKIDDIPGTKAKPLMPPNRAVRNPLDYSDVPLSHAGAVSEARRRKTLSKNLTVADINAGDGRRVAARDSNPLEPTYTVSLPLPSGHTKQVNIGQVDGSKPRTMPAARADRPLLSLRSDDIDGAKPTNHLPYPKDRREWKKTCDVSDIDTKGKRRLY